MSSDSPIARSPLISIITISDAVPLIASVYAIVEPTLPVPIMVILFIRSPHFCYITKTETLLVMRLLKI